MLLKELLNEWIGALQSGEAIARNRWAERNCGRLSQIAQEGLILKGLITEMAAKQRGVKMEIDRIQASRQLQLPFNLPFAVTIDPTSTVSKATHSLLRDEMQTAISMRETNVRHAQLELSEFKAGFRAAEPYWEQHPDWTFGQCIEAYIAPANNNTVGSVRVAA